MMGNRLWVVWAQISQWPPTTSTVIGGGVLIGLISYIWTGSLELAIGVGAVLVKLCPEAAPAVQTALDLDKAVIPHEGKVT